MKEFLKNNIIVITGNILGKVNTFLLMSVIIKKFGIDIYGEYVLIFSVIGLFAGLSNFGIGYTYKRKMPSTEIKIEQSNLFYSQFWGGLSLTLVLIFIIGLLNKSFYNIFFDGEINLNFYLLLFSFLIYTLYTQFIDYFRYTNKIKTYTVFSTLMPYLFFAFLMLLKPEKEINIIFIYLSIAIFLSILISFPIIISKIGFSISGISQYDYENDLKYGFPLVLVIVMNFIINTSDRYIILHFLSSSDVGLYSAAFAIGAIISFYPMVLSTILPQVLIKAHDNNNITEQTKYFSTSLYLFILISTPFVCLMSVLGNNIFNIFVVSDQIRLINSLIVFISLGAFFSGLTIILNILLFINYKTRYTLKVTILGGIVAIASNLVLLSIFKSILVCSISYFVSNLLIFLLIKTPALRFLNIKLDYNRIGRYFVSSLALVILIKLLDILFRHLGLPAYIKLAIEIITAILIYLVILKKEIISTYKLLVAKPF